MNSTTLCGFFRNLSKSVILPYLNHIYKVSLKIILLVCSLVERRVKNWKLGS